MNQTPDYIQDDVSFMERRELNSKFRKLRKILKETTDELVRMELACVSLPTFDPNGAGNCADRQIAAINELLARKDAAWDIINNLVTGMLISDPKWKPAVNWLNKNRKNS